MQLHTCCSIWKLDADDVYDVTWMQMMKNMKHYKPLHHPLNFSLSPCLVGECIHRERLNFHSKINICLKKKTVKWERRKEKESNNTKRRNIFILLRIFTNDSSFSTHHFSVPSGVSIECWTHDSWHLIIVSETTPHNSTQTILFNNTPLTRSGIESKRSVILFLPVIEIIFTSMHNDSISTRVEFH